MLFTLKYVEHNSRTGILSDPKIIGDQHSVKECREALRIIRQHLPSGVEIASATANAEGWPPVDLLKEKEEPGFEDTVSWFTAA